MKLFVCGDIMPGGVLPYQPSFYTQELKEYMGGFDFRIGTLEAAFGTNYNFDPVKMRGRHNIIFARNEDFFRVVEMGFDVVSLANNHVWDLCEDGLKNTISLLNQNNIQFCGAGMDIEEASRPAIVEKDGIRVAFFAYCMYGNPWLGYVELAGEHKAGVNPLDIDRVLEDIKKAKQEYDRVVVLPHWGREYKFEPLPECIAMAKQMIKAGADAVLGSHPHQIQPLVYFNGRPVCFSMGNFLFPDFYMYPPRPIWYPDSIEEVKDVKDVVGYPFPIEEPIRQVWNPDSRYGCTIELVFQGKGTKANIRYVCSTKDNVETLTVITTSIQHQLQKAYALITNPFLRVLVKIKRDVFYFLKRLRNRTRERFKYHLLRKGI